MAYFLTENPELGKFWRVLHCKLLVYYMSIWSILRPLDIFSGHLVYFMVILVYFGAIWYILRPFGICNLLLFIIFLSVLVFCTEKIWQPRAVAVEEERKRRM
jgi:hypothetical protein